MSFYEPRLGVMGWFYSHFEQSHMEGREDKTLKTQERQIRRGGGGVKDQCLESIFLISKTQEERGLYGWKCMILMMRRTKTVLTFIGHLKI